MIYGVEWRIVNAKGWVPPRWLVQERLGELSGPHNCRAYLADVIRETEENTFVFILRNDQQEEFNAWIKEFNLGEYEVYRMAQPITNPIHGEAGRNLTLIVLASKKHVWRDMFDDEGEDCEN